MIRFMQDLIVLDSSLGLDYTVWNINSIMRSH